MNVLYVCAEQEEVDRLRKKLDTVVSSVEAVIQDAQAAQVRRTDAGGSMHVQVLTLSLYSYAQDEIKAEHDREVHALRLKYARLEDENDQVQYTPPGAGYMPVECRVWKLIRLYCDGYSLSS